MNDKLFLICFDSGYNQEAIKKFLDKSTKVSYWFYNTPNTIFAKSALSYKELYEHISNKFGSGSTLFVTQIKGNMYGRMPEEHWEYIKTIFPNTILDF